MNESNQKTVMKRLREEGMTYAQIASALNVSVSSVKTFFHRSKSQKEVVRCAECHRPLPEGVVNRTRRFCSDACRLKWWGAHQESLSTYEQHQVRCAYCGKLFYSRKSGKFCSKACFYHSRRKAGVSDE